MNSSSQQSVLVRRIIIARSGKLFLSFLFFLVKHSPVWLLPLYVSGLINSVVDGKDLFSQITPTLIIAVLLVLNVPFQALHVRYFSQASRHIEKELRTSLIRKLQELSILYYQENQSGGLSAKFLRDVEAIELALKQIVMSLLPALISFVYVFGVTTVRQPLVSLFFLGAIPLMYVVRTVFSGKLQKDNREYRKDMEKLSAKVIESIEMLPVARAHAVEETEINEIETFFQRITSSGLELDITNAVFGAWTWVILQLFSLLALVFSAWMAIIGKIPLGDIVLYQSFFAMISNALASLLTILPVLYRGRESFLSISEVLDAPDLENNRGKPEFERVEGSFRIADLAYQYPGSAEAALTIPELSIPFGQSVGIVGPSGSGKTTFINLIIGFLQAEHGDVFLDEQTYRDHDLRSMRRYLSVVGQTPILFSGTIAANISYGDPRGPEERDDEVRIIEALKAANALEFVQELPDGIHSHLGEHAANLSGGQRQRLVLARAFYRNPRILIFDEATSALDSHSEQRVQQALATIAHGRTSFIVAHRLSTIMEADRILVFDKGRIVQDGSPEALLAESGLFRELAAVQGFTSGT
ncbi:ABC transporter ATP-binding protein [Spirochaeta dissipatitropha]